MSETTESMASKVFLALCVWRESRGEHSDAQAGVAHCIMNRVARPSWWGRNVQDVIFKKWQFSSMTDPNDKQLTTWPKSGDISWDKCMDIAIGVLNGSVKNPVPGADSYYDISIKPPKWAAPNQLVKRLGRLNFYNIDNDVEIEGGAK